MEKKINYADYQLNSFSGNQHNNNNYYNNQGHQNGLLGIASNNANSIFEPSSSLQQSESISSNTSSDQYQYYANSYSEAINYQPNPQYNLQSQTVAAGPQSTATSYNTNQKINSASKPFFHSPQFENISKGSFPNANMTLSPEQIPAHLPLLQQSQSTQPKHSINFHQIEQSSQTFPQLNVMHTNSNISADSNYTPQTPSFDTDSLYYSQEGSVKSNKQQRRSFQASSYTNYFQRAPFINTFPKNNNQQNNNYKSNSTLSQNPFSNCFVSPPIQLIKNRNRKQSFTSSTSTCDDSTDYQFRARSGSFQSTLNSQFNNPNKKKQIDDRGSRKMKRMIKGNHNKNNQQYAQPNTITFQHKLNQLNNLGFEEIHEHDFDNHRITNEDLITTHQEQMKEEQQVNGREDYFQMNLKNQNSAHKNSKAEENEDYNELNISEKEDELDNLDDITLESVHKQNYGCSMIDQILDECENEDDCKGERIGSNTITSSQNNLDHKPVKGYLEKEDQQKMQMSIFNRLIAQNNDQQNQIIKNNNHNSNNHDKPSENESENKTSNSNSSSNSSSNNSSSSSGSSNDSEQIVEDFSMSQENMSSQRMLESDMTMNPTIKRLNEEYTKNESNLNNLLDQANMHMQNPQALFEIVQKLASQIREKNQTIKNMELESSEVSLKSLSQINIKSDEVDESKLIKNQFKNLSLEETKLEQE